MRGVLFKARFALFHGSFDNFITIRTHINTIVTTDCIHHHVVSIYTQSTIFCIATSLTKSLITAPWLCITFNTGICTTSNLINKMTVIKITKSTGRSRLSHIAQITCITNLLLIIWTSRTVRINSSATCAGIWTVCISLIIIISSTILTLMWSSISFLINRTSYACIISITCYIIRRTLGTFGTCQRSTIIITDITIWWTRLTISSILIKGYRACSLTCICLD